MYYKYLSVIYQTKKYLLNGFRTKSVSGTGNELEKSLFPKKSTSAFVTFQMEKKYDGSLDIVHF